MNNEHYAHNSPVKFITAAKFANADQSKHAYEALEEVARNNAGRGYGILVRRFMIPGSGYHVALLTLKVEPDHDLQKRIRCVFTSREGEETTLSIECVHALCTPMDFMSGHETQGGFTRWRSGF